MVSRIEKLGAGSRCLLHCSTNSGTGATDSHGERIAVMVKSHCHCPLKISTRKNRKLVGNLN